MSKVLVDWLMLPCENCCLIDFVAVPAPTEFVCRGVEPKMSPNSARLFLNPLEPTLAMLLEVVAISVCAPFKPVNAV